jgi:hypothetical protein
MFSYPKISIKPTIVSSSMEVSNNQCLAPLKNFCGISQIKQRKFYYHRHALFLTPEISFNVIVGTDEAVEFVNFAFVPLLAEVLTVKLFFPFSIVHAS